MIRPCGSGLRLALLVALTLTAGCGEKGSTRFAGSPLSPEVVYGQCALCHGDIAARLVSFGGHHDLSISCEQCHGDLHPGDIGPGHRAVPACRDCHGEQRTHHDPAAAALAECRQCHTAHGSPNLFLVRELVATPQREAREVSFTNLRGRADGGLAGASRPGSGLCEICHTETRYYRAGGTGQAHFTLACFPCHPHGAGFAPR